MKADARSVSNSPMVNETESISLEDLYISLKLTEASSHYHHRIPRGMTEKIFANPEINNRKIEAPLKKGRIIAPEMAVERFQRIVVCGPPGAGKTLLIKYLTIKYCDENIALQAPNKFMIVPVPITLRALSRHGNKLRPAVDAVFERYHFPDAKNAAEKNLSAGKCLLLLDGFDELIAGNKGELEKTAAEILAFIDKYPACRVIVTTRASISHDIPQEFKLLEISGFDQRMIKQFIDNRFDNIGRKKTAALRKVLMEDENLGEMASNPLILSIITAIYREGMELPRNRAELYRQITDTLLNKWDTCKRLRNRFTAHQKKFILKKLAFQCHAENRRTLPENEILMTIGEYASGMGLKKGENRSLLEEICRRSNILEKVSGNIYRFHYLSFQEYFTALELSERENAVDTIIPHLTEPWWEEPILLFVRLSKTAETLIGHLRETVPEDIFFTRLMLTGKCLADADYTAPRLIEKTAGDIWHIYNSSEFSLLKEKTMTVLSRLKPRNIIDILVNQLTDGDTRNRRTAIENLGLIGGTDDLPALIMVLVKDNDNKVRAQAAEALGKIGSPEGILPLINTLHIDKDTDVRRVAAAALGVLGGPEALSALGKALTADNSSAVRGSAAETMGNIGNIGAIPRLIRAISTERESPVRWRIAMALGKLQGSDARDVLIEALSTDKDRAVRESAAEALGWIGSDECIRALVKALSFDEDADVRGSAAYALGYTGNENALPVLIKALITDTDGEVRGRAAYALGRMKKVEAIPYLTAVFSGHKESIIRGNATYALGEIGGVESIPFLIQAITLDKDAYVRYRAAEVLGSIGNIMAIPPLQTALKDEGSYYGWKVKDKAFEALEKVSRRLGVRISS